VPFFLSACLCAWGLGFDYLENGWRYRLGYNRALIGNGTWGIKWSMTGDVTWPVKVVTQLYLYANISKTVSYRGSVPIGHK